MGPAVHRTVVAVDVEGFGAVGRTDAHREAVRDGLYRGLETAFAASGVQWSACYHEDRGDGALILVGADVPKALLVKSVPHALAGALREHNAVHSEPAQIRLRMAIHAGEVRHDGHGVVGTSINHTFRLLDVPDLRTARADSSDVLTVIVSSWFFDEVVRHSAACDPDAYRRVEVAVKETRGAGWLLMSDTTTRPPRQAVTPAAVATDGMATIGGTALAVHAAYRMTERYLEALGVPDEWIAACLDHRAVLWRGMAAGRRMLFVPDHAAVAEWAAPLLGCLVLVTTGSTPHSMSLDMLPVAGAARFGSRPA